MDRGLKDIQNKHAEADFFDDITRIGKYDALTQRAYDRLVLFFEKFIQPEAEEKVLDLGCGTGAFTEQLKRFDLDLTGVDISRNAVGFAKKMNPDIKFVVSDIERLGFKDGYFDVVIFSAVLHHFEDFSKCASEAYRVLRKGGRFFAFDPNVRNLFMRVYRNMRFISRSTHTINERLLSKEELERVFKEARFSVSVIAASGIELKQANRGIFDKFLFLYNLLERGSVHIPLPQYYGSHLITYGIKP